MVFTAASLNDIILELAQDFERAAGCRVSVSAGASGALRKQIESGAPCDVFVSADAAQVDALLAKGLCETESRRIIATNQLALAVRRDLVSAGPWPQGLRNEAIRRLSIADPDVAPAGRYAREALIHEGLWNEISTKLVIAEDVRGAAMHVNSGVVDAAIVYATDVRVLSAAVVAHTFDPKTHGPIEYVAARVRPAGGSDGPERHGSHDAARRFLDYLTSEDSETIFKKHGFSRTRE